MSTIMLKDRSVARYRNYRIEAQRRPTPVRLSSRSNQVPSNSLNGLRAEPAPSSAAYSAPGALWGSLLRLGGFLGFWLVLAGFDATDLPAGTLAAVIATGASLRLLPPGRRSLRPTILLRFAIRFVRQSVVAGLDVAWRALDPRLPLRPGFIIYQTRLPPGPMRNAFCTIASLLPGTLPSGPDESGALVIHCLDLTQPVTAQLTADEALLIEIFGGTGHNG